METREQIMDALLAATRRLGTTPQRFFAGRAWSVGHYPEGRPLPAVETLAVEQLHTLAGLAEQAARLA